VYSAVHATVELAKEVCPGAAGLVNAVLRAVQQRPPVYPAASDDALAHLLAYASHPEWLLRRWLDRFGAAETAALCAYANRRPSLCLRVHAGRMSRADVLAALPGSEPASWSTSSVRCRAGSFAAARRLVAAGAASVQDESATLVVEEADPQPGQVWIDLAASPGGKCGHLAERVGPEGLVRAYDRTPAKVERLRQNAVRMGLPQLLVGLADARALRAPAADGVLLDAPCSGLGVLGRRPDARWRKREGDLPRLRALQSELLDAAAALVRPGGVLVYSVCSFEPEETVAVCERFRSGHAGFRLEAGGAPAPLRAGAGILYFLPQRHGMDGGFVARWRREV
jgi:16S rRNA (cytosine967-C5)-methyltransferase